MVVMLKNRHALGWSARIGASRAPSYAGIAVRACMFQCSSTRWPVGSSSTPRLVASTIHHDAPEARARRTTSDISGSSPSAGAPMMRASEEWGDATLSEAPIANGPVAFVALAIANAPDIDELSNRAADIAAHAT